MMRHVTPNAASGLAALCRKHKVVRLALFGSAATGAFDPLRSDLDFLVSFAPMEPVDYADAYFGLREGLAALFERDIDLLTEASLANPYLRRQVLAESQTVFEAA
jgi:uncharacterized protein